MNKTSVAESMLSDELQSRPELLVQFVQNTFIPLGEGLEEPVSIAPQSLPLPSRSAFRNQAPASGGSPASKPSAPASQLVVQDTGNAEPSDGTGDYGAGNAEPSDGTGNTEVKDGAGNDEPRDGAGNAEHRDGGGNAGAGNAERREGAAPLYLRIQELAHDSLVAATRAQLARDVGEPGEPLHSCCRKEGKPEPSPGPQRNEKTLRCSYEGCSRTFLWHAHLKYHLKTHRNDRSYTCPKEGCGKSFYVLQRLKVHMRTHNGEKPFICPEDECGKKFTTAGNLKNHIRIHSGEKPFVCEARNCRRSFTEYSSLRKHMVVHSGEKPYRCNICEKTFSQSGSRNVHLRKYHNILLAFGDQEDAPANLFPEAGALSEAVTVAGLSEAPGPVAEQARLELQPLVLPPGILGAEQEVLPENLPSVSNTTATASVVVVPQPHHLVTISTAGHSYEEVVTVLLQ
ncbi:zinc finger protein 410 isoform X2 [Callorhinchus milii]|uniref:zinc finger protein 410 isoform X2 n=1 Tax=Callorhinchus milii TaxID=7868 RepID=UPI0004571555|nr:zinc finger protein 410 isoform X2 [Callorhinchus milii]|eukprot:gi/632975412/ref/XP_007904215.1/ PREDICTED: zinc finger protein 410 isoform X2 [Callorhinchus milii]